MKSITFPEANRVLGRNQPQYNPLACHVDLRGVVTSCWEFTEEEVRDMIAKNGTVKIYVSQYTFGSKLQPLCVQTKFNPPKV